ncbi:MAG: GNAT family N-acetyltransferase [Bacilli bacterium]|nr:GNAT family N-acetyltransferase [Bacilli bacterium]
MDYEIRRANENDIKRLASFRRITWDETYRGIYNDSLIDNYDYEKAERTFKSIFENENISLYVVESENEIVGYMDVGSPRREYGDYEQEIGLLYLRKSFQNRGLGRKLFDLAKDEIKQNGYNRFFVSCNKYNKNACKFYEKMGGILIDEDPEDEDKRKVYVKYHYDV